GDETGNSQQGNNTAYCQDNPVGWVDWAGAADLTATLRELIAVRKAPGLVQTAFPGVPRAGRLHPGGGAMEAAAWGDAGLRAVGWPRGWSGGVRLRLFNAGGYAEFALPEGRWRCVLDTAGGPVLSDDRATGNWQVAGQSVAVLRAD